MYKKVSTMGGIIRIPFSNSFFEYDFYNFDLVELSLEDKINLNRRLSGVVYAFVVEKLQNS